MIYLVAFFTFALVLAEAQPVSNESSQMNPIEIGVQYFLGEYFSPKCLEECEDSAATMEKRQVSKWKRFIFPP